ncbi:hypothetical protein NMY22_g17724 [Coprinellus aureogranulatus]|nr:hypothetical protein NMY22_g17724 [Coprinellus aureogranulatus]
MPAGLSEHSSHKTVEPHTPGRITLELPVDFLGSALHPACLAPLSNTTQWPYFSEPIPSTISTRQNFGHPEPAQRFQRGRTSIFSERFNDTGVESSYDPFTLLQPRTISHPHCTKACWRFGLQERHIQIMDVGSSSTGAWVKFCACGKSFYKPNSYSNHIRSCKPHKLDVGSALQNAKARHAKKVQEKKGKGASSSRQGLVDLDVDVVPAIPTTEGSAVGPTLLASEEPPAGPAIKDSASLEQGVRIRRPNQMFKDFHLTSSIPFAGPMVTGAMDLETPPQSPARSPTSEPPLLDPADRRNLPLTPVQLRQLIHQESAWKATPSNPFGVYKRFWTTEDRVHDPDLLITDADLQDEESSATPPALAQDGVEQTDDNPFYPFPNWREEPRDVQRPVKCPH